MHEIKIWERKTPHVGGLPIAIRWGSKEGFFEKQGLSAHRRKNTESERRKMKEERGLFIHLAIEKFFSERWEELFWNTHMRPFFDSPTIHPTIKKVQRWQAHHLRRTAVWILRWEAHHLRRTNAWIWRWETQPWGGFFEKNNLHKSGERCTIWG